MDTPTVLTVNDVDSEKGVKAGAGGSETMSCVGLAGGVQVAPAILAADANRDTGRTPRVAMATEKAAPPFLPAWLMSARTPPNPERGPSPFRTRTIRRGIPLRHLIGREVLEHWQRTRKRLLGNFLF